MQIVPYTKSRKVAPSKSTTIWEYDTTDKDLSGGVAHIQGRYPEKGYATNTKSKELVYVLTGSGSIVTPKTSYDIEVGDEILIETNEKYAWEGQMALFMATAPKFNAKQHKIIL